MTIIANGSKWAGDPPDDLATLLEVLKKHPLEPAFAFRKGTKQLRITPRVDDYIRPVTPRPPEIGDTIANGNFITVSHVFLIIGKEEEFTELSQAIEANLKKFKPTNRSQWTRTHYQAQEKP